MLVLSRKVGEWIQLGEIWIRICALRGNEVILGFLARKAIPIHREEVFDRIAESGGTLVPNSGGSGTGFLLIHREMDQRVLIGDNTDPDECWSVMVVEVRGDKVRLGLRAPREVTIHRAEVAYCCFLEDLKTAGIASQSEEGRRRLRETFPERLRTEMAW